MYKNNYKGTSKWVKLLWFLNIDRLLYNYENMVHNSLSYVDMLIFNIRMARTQLWKLKTTQNENLITESRLRWSIFVGVAQDWRWQKIKDLFSHLSASSLKSKARNNHYNCLLIFSIKVNKYEIYRFRIEYYILYVQDS